MGILQFRKKDRILLVVFTGLILLLSVFQMLIFKEYERRNIGVSIADYLIYYQHPYFIGFLFMPIFICLQNLSLYPMRYNYIIRKGSREKLYEERVKNIIVTAVYFSIMAIITSILVGLVYGVPMINWSQENSFFFEQVHKVTQTGFVDVAIKVGIAMMLLLSIYGIIFDGIIMMVESYALAWITIMLVATWEFMSGGLLRYIQWSYEYFIMGVNVFFKIFVGIAMLGVLIMVVRIVMQRKDFLKVTG